MIHYERSTNSKDYGNGIESCYIDVTTNAVPWPERIECHGAKDVPFYEENSAENLMQRVYVGVMLYEALCKKGFSHDQLLSIVEKL